MELKLSDLYVWEIILKELGDRTKEEYRLPYLSQVLDAEIPANRKVGVFLGTDTTAIQNRAIENRTQHKPFDIHSLFLMDGFDDPKYGDWIVFKLPDYVTDSLTTIVITYGSKEMSPEIVVHFDQDKETADIFSPPFQFENNFFDRVVHPAIAARLWMEGYFPQHPTCIHEHFDTESAVTTMHVVVSYLCKHFGVRHLPFPDVSPKDAIDCFRRCGSHNDSFLDDLAEFMQYDKDYLEMLRAAKELTDIDKLGDRFSSKAAVNVVTCFAGKCAASNVEGKDAQILTQAMKTIRGY